MRVADAVLDVVGLALTLALTIAACRDLNARVRAALAPFGEVQLEPAAKRP